MSEVVFCPQYYYNTQTQQFLYWDSERCTYMPAPTTQDNQTTTATTTASTVGTDVITAEEQRKEEELKKQTTPEKKVKVAKKIVKASLTSHMCGIAYGFLLQFFLYF